MNKKIDALTERFDNSLFVLMQNLGPQVIKRTQLELTPGQVFMLHYIQKKSQCSVSKLAEKMEVAPSAITVMVDRLVNNGFVNRTRDKTDRRVVKIELTNAGEEKLNQVLHARKHIVQHCLTQINTKELDSFIQTLESLASIANSLDVEKIIEMSN